MLLAKLRMGELNALDFGRGFLETLGSLADVAISHEDAVKILRNRIRAGIATYVARIEGQVVGTASLLAEDKFIHNGGRVGHIEDVAVHREHKKQGIGAASVRHAIDKARELGCYKVILDCTEQLVPFYEQLGFRRHEQEMRLDF